MRKANTGARPNSLASKLFSSVLLFLLAGSIGAQAQCIGTGNMNGSLFTSDNSNNASLDFSATANVTASDNNYTSAQALVALLGTNRTQYLKATGFNFSIPANATICGVTVHIRKRANGISILTRVEDDEVKIIKDGIISGTSKHTNTDWPSNFVTESYSGDNTYWGTTLTAADVNDPQFGVAISAKMISTVNAFPSVEIDHISMVVEYQPVTVSPLSVQSFTTLLQKNVVYCQWTMAEEEAGAQIILQQSTDNRQWKDISSYTVNAHAAQTKYKEVVRLTSKDNYFYRLKMIGKDHRATYSKTNSLQYSGSGELKLFPTVAKSMIYLENIDPTDKVQVYSFNNQLMQTTAIQVSDNMLAIRISNLPKGMYLLKTGKTTRRFIKD